MLAGVALVEIWLIGVSLKLCCACRSRTYQAGQHCCRAKDAAFLPVKSHDDPGQTGALDAFFWATEAAS